MEEQNELTLYESLYITAPVTCGDSFPDQGEAYNRAAFPFRQSCFVFQQSREHYTCIPIDVVAANSN